jgi:hypothetical protein
MDIVTGPMKQLRRCLKRSLLAASPSTLRRLAQFFAHVADEMELHGESFGHEHFEDFAHDEEQRPALVVTRDAGMISNT